MNKDNSNNEKVLEKDLEKDLEDVEIEKQKEKIIKPRLPPITRKKIVINLNNTTSNANISTDSFNSSNNSNSSSSNSTSSSSISNSISSSSSNSSISNSISNNSSNSNKRIKRLPMPMPATMSKVRPNPTIRSTDRPTVSPTSRPSSRISTVNNTTSKRRQDKNIALFARLIQLSQKVGKDYCDWYFTQQKALIKPPLKKLQTLLALNSNLNYNANNERENRDLARDKIDLEYLISLFTDVLKSQSQEVDLLLNDNTVASTMEKENERLSLSLSLSLKNKKDYIIDIPRLGRIARSSEELQLKTIKVPQTFLNIEEIPFIQIGIHNIRLSLEQLIQIAEQDGKDNRDMIESYKILLNKIFPNL